MEALGHLRTVLRHPSILRSYQPLLLISHMRANTSLMGHILGASPEIEGYYELHIGYHSWRSLLRQKLVYFDQHTPKPHARYMFDKVLTNQHGVNTDVLRHGKMIFTLRPPERTIRSIVNLYSAEFPDDPCARVSGAIDYYVARLQTIGKMATKTLTPFIYIDADALRDQTDRVLQALTSYLGLGHALSAEYQTKPLTGQRRAGDSSPNISLGRISGRQHDYSGIRIDESLLQPARTIFEQVRHQLISHPLVVDTTLLEGEL